MYVYCIESYCGGWMRGTLIYDCSISLSPNSTLETKLGGKFSYRPFKQGKNNMFIHMCPFSSITSRHASHGWTIHWKPKWSAWMLNPPTYDKFVYCKLHTRGKQYPSFMCTICANALILSLSTPKLVCTSYWA